MTAFGRTDRGQVRSENQDHLLVADLGDAFPEAAPVEERSDRFSVGPVEFELGDEGAILLVADGMGGRAGGGRASGMAVSAVREAMAEGRGSQSGQTAAQFARRLERSLGAANAAIHQESSRGGEFKGMGTTATLAGLFDGSVYVAQVGDSRAYLVRNEDLGRLTRDQSLVQDLIDSGVLDEDDAHNVQDNMILQALGVAPTVRPAVTYHHLRRGDVMVLCSDGLSQMVRDDEIRHTAARATDCVALCDELVGLANARGGPDNITVLVARIDGRGVEAAGDEGVVARQRYEMPES